jgi:hypothetical protein
MQLFWLIGVALLGILIAQLVISLPLQLFQASFGLFQYLILGGLLLLLAWFLGD